MRLAALKLLPKSLYALFLSWGIRDVVARQVGPQGLGVALGGRFAASLGMMLSPKPDRALLDVLQAHGYRYESSHDRSIARTALPKYNLNRLLGR